MPSPTSLNLRATLTGILPPLAMPFDKKGDVIYSALGEQIDHAVASGVGGIVVGGSTGEGHTLGRDEFAQDHARKPQGAGGAASRSSPG